MDLQSRIMDEYNEERLGTVMEVLCEGFDSQAGCFVGRTYADSVEIDGHVYFTAAGRGPGRHFCERAHHRRIRRGSDRRGRGLIPLCTRTSTNARGRFSKRSLVFLTNLY